MYYTWKTVHSKTLQDDTLTSRLHPFPSYVQPAHRQFFRHDIHHAPVAPFTIIPSSFCLQNTETLDCHRALGATERLSRRWYRRLQYLAVGASAGSPHRGYTVTDVVEGQHEQLPLAVTVCARLAVSDSGLLTEAGAYRVADASR